MRFVCGSLEDVPGVAKKILDYCSGYKKFVFYGSMGVGKTTLIKELSLQLGVVDIVTSPTFSIVNHYHTLEGETVYHFDFYRLDNEKEAFDMGYEEYFFGDSYCFIEWPERVPNLIENGMVLIKIELDGVKRLIEITI